MIQFLEKNRKNIAEFLQADSALILFSGKSIQSSADAHHPFVVNRNFYYMTGLNREGFIFVLQKKDKEFISHLFIEKPNYEIEKWVGRKMTKEEAIKQSGIAKVDYSDSFETFINSEIKKGAIKMVYGDLERQTWQIPDTYDQKWFKSFKDKYLDIAIKSAIPYLVELRMIKDAYEIDQIKQAIALTKQGLDEVLKTLTSTKWEYQLDAVFTHSIRYNGCSGNSFPTIVASGDNAVILHYVENNCQLQDSKLVLLDLGGLYHLYSADISRTYPISGKYNTRQKQLYNIVLGAMEAVTKKMKPGTPFEALNETCKTYLANALKEIGLIKHDDELGKYYYHGVSHHLGLDVHDYCDRASVLKPGMVLTVEPGLYIAEEGIGIRIEDDILITADGNENLSKAIIKKPEEIEKAMRN